MFPGQASQESKDPTRRRACLAMTLDMLTAAAIHEAGRRWWMCKRLRRRRRHGHVHHRVGSFLNRVILVSIGADRKMRRELERE